jgi:hypothetical protein
MVCDAAVALRAVSFLSVCGSEKTLQGFVSYIGLVGETCERMKVTSHPANVQVVLAGVTPTSRNPLTLLQHPSHFSRTSSHSFREVYLKRISFTRISIRVSSIAAVAAVCSNPKHIPNAEARQNIPFRSQNKES